MHRFLIVISVLIFATSFIFTIPLFQATRTSSQPQPAQESSGQVLSATRSESEAAVPTSALFTTEKLYLLINAHRKDHNLSPLNPSSQLETSAHLKVQDMIAKNYWQHADPDNIQSWPLFKSAGYTYSLAGENLSFANNSAWDVFSSWVASSKHNEQLLTPEYEDMGVVIDCETYQNLADQPCIVVLHLGKK